MAGSVILNVCCHLSLRIWGNKKEELFDTVLDLVRHKEAAHRSAMTAYAGGEPLTSRQYCTVFQPLVTSSLYLISPLSNSSFIASQLL